MPQGELERLRERKKELLLESDINRQILRVEFCQLKLKASDWRRNLFRARTAYHWLAPIAAMALTFYRVRRGIKAHRRGTHHNGRGAGKSAYLQFLAPLGFAAMRRAFAYLRHARKRAAAVSDHR
jgi:hypothetical protein